MGKNSSLKNASVVDYMTEGQFAAPVGRHLTREDCTARHTGTLLPSMSLATLSASFSSYVCLGYTLTAHILGQSPSVSFSGCVSN